MTPPAPAVDRLRIALVVHDYHRHGGHSRYAVELATRFRRDHEVHVFTNRVDDPDTAGITFHHVRAWRGSALGTILSFAGPATAAVRPGRFDVVHAQGFCGFRHDVVTAHACHAAWFAAFDRAGVRLPRRRRVFQAVVPWLERRAVADPPARRVIAVSHRIRADLAEYYGRSDGVDVVYHGVDTVAFHPDHRGRDRAPVRADLGLRGRDFVALFVGDLQKGAAAAVRAVARVPGVTLLVVSGSDPAPDRAVAAAEGVSDRVVFHPHARDVARFYAAADAFVFPTMYDSYGMVISEAMAAGLPVITSRMAGAAELIDAGVDGLLTDDPWDVLGIAAHLTALRDAAGLRNRLGAAARRKIEPYTWNRTAAETMAVYRGVVARRRS